MCRHLPIFTPRRQGTIFGTTGLNFRVRYGNGWTPCVINTDCAVSQQHAYYTPQKPICQLFFAFLLLFRTADPISGQIMVNNCPKIKVCCQTVKKREKISWDKKPLPPPVLPRVRLDVRAAFGSNYFNNISIAECRVSVQIYPCISAGNSV